MRRRIRGVSAKRGAPAKRILSERDLLVQVSNLTGCAVRAKKHPEWTSNPSRVFHFSVGAVVLQHGGGSRLERFDEIECVFSLGAPAVDNAIQFIFRLQIDPDLRGCAEETA